MNIKSIRAFVCAGFLAFTSSVFAGNFITQITSISSTTHLQINWSTNIDTGDLVNVGNLSDLTYYIYDGSTLVYTDAVIIGGEIQDIGGVSRSLGDLSFNAISGQSVSTFDNDIPVIQEEAAFGLTYNIYGSATGNIYLESYSNGVAADADTLSNLSQNTVSVIPEPSAFAAFAGLTVLSSAAFPRRRKSA